MWLLSSIYYVTLEHDFLFRFRELEEKDTGCIYVIKTAPNNLIISSYLLRVSRSCRVLRQNSYVRPNNALCTSQ